MRQGSNNQINRRGRGRGHNHNNSSSNPRRHNNNGGGHRNQNFDSNGPQGRIRGTAKQVCDKYLQLAKDAISAGDRVLAESLFQHADHYGRIAALHAPKPKPEDNISEGDNDAGTSQGNSSSDAVKVDIEDGDEGRKDKVAQPDSSGDTVEEKPKRRASSPRKDTDEEKPKRRAPVARRTPRKRKEDDDAPKLGGGTNAVPDFLARPVDVDNNDAKEAPAAQEDTAEEKPKRRTTRRTTTPRKTPATPRKKAKKDDDDSSDSEKEAS